MLRKSPLVLLLLCATYPVAVKCQVKSKDQIKPFEIAFSIAIADSKFYNDGFINSLNQQNLPAGIGSSSLEFNSDIYLSKLTPNTKVIAIIGVGIANGKGTSKNITVNANAVTNDYNLHYIVWKRPRQYFYPGIGFGWTAYKYSFVNRDNVAVSYPASLQDFSGERTLESGDLTYLNISARYDWVIDKSNNFLLGIRGSYHLGLNRKNLQLSDGYELTQSPELKANALSIGVAFTVQ